MGRPSSTSIQATTISDTSGASNSTHTTNVWQTKSSTTKNVQLYGCQSSKISNLENEILEEILRNLKDNFGKAD